MPARVTFKTMKHGNAVVITIPKPYRDYHGLDAGSEVVILFDSLLLVVPKNLEAIIKDKQQLIDRLLGAQQVAKGGN